VFQKEKYIAFILLFFCFLIAPAAAQEQQRQNQNEEKEKQEKKKQEKVDPKNLTAEQLAETVIFAYGGLGGRATLTAIRKTELERGEIIKYAPDGVTVAERATYEKRTSRGESQEKDRIRIDQKLSAAQYALIHDASKTFGIINDTVFVPREEAERGFQASLFHSLDALLRYKENGSTLKMAGRDKKMGVDYYQLDVTDKLNRTTRYNISSKLFRVISLEYEFSPTAAGTPVKYVRKFYDHRPAQGMFVPWRTVLLVDGKPVEETNISTVTYGTKIEDANFQAAE
jgi:hypothetical protein